MKKLLIVLLSIFALFISLTEIKATDEIISIDFYAMNDFHGALFADKGAGISRIGQYLIEQKNNNPENTIILSSGDMFQGTAVSSMSRGNVVVDCMNAIGFDSMTIGNHEFDWGSAEIKKFVDGNEENGEAHFPLICANIIENSTNELADFVEPYAIVERSGIKIGIIGLIAESCKNDILASFVEPFSFTNQIEAVKKYAPILRNQEGCDIVVVSTHDGEASSDISSITSSIAYRLSTLTGEEKIDAVFNGHSHYKYSGEFNNNGYNMAYVQSGGNGQNIGKITIKYNKTTHKAVDSYASNIYTLSNCKTESTTINNILNNYSEMIELANSELGSTSNTIYREEGALWAATVLKYAAGADVGIVNYGGIRSNAFPLNGTIKYDDIFELSPFENMVVVVELTGSQINQMTRNMNTTNLYFSDGDTTFNSSTTYRVATIDYLFEKTSYPFMQGKNINRSQTVFREYLVNEIKMSMEKYGSWSISKIAYSEIDNKVENIVISNVTDNSITINSVNNHQYSIDNINWITPTDSTVVFSGLTPRTTYTIYYRLVDSDNIYHTEVTTKYAQGSEPITPVVLASTSTSITIKVENNHEYSLDGVEWVTPLENTYTFENLVPKTNYLIYAKNTISLEIVQLPYKTPISEDLQAVIPTVVEKTINSIKITVDPNCEYSLDYVNWIKPTSDSHTFENLKSGKTYTIYVRHCESKDSTSIKVDTVSEEKEPSNISFNCEFTSLNNLFNYSIVVMGLAFLRRKNNSI